MDLELRDALVLVTGGSKGIGLACAEVALAEGARVALVSRSQDHLDAAAERLGAGERVRTFAADLTDPQQALDVVARVEAEAGPVDVLVCSAGAARRTPYPELDAAAWSGAMQAKFFTYVHVIDPVVKAMAARGRGSIVNVIGFGGKLANPTHLAGGAANAALMLATAGLANAYGPQGVRVNAVNPAGTLTERLGEGIKAAARLEGISEDEALARQTAGAPLGRLAEPREVAETVMYLASARASYVNGSIVSMDGGAAPIVV
ncbi:NAD(P)-dependent dehydrogenase, short-chain alcohol dehydrogenase family [Nocardioides scoriae]|uniref:NAD(P)-dependent dehydrogenase, short-chain alcohol dehydrogenase family n=1 Tax=Nocardioides scoriae TaxID=642780 RepID=A0A1H1M5Z6_9ACTN|nr:SDR family oxidoreductase [Nocardioides scoriae]SDR82176.1 NAD(P)-dependent dehydrogenase, short-chain alcohol dehydrogenase family [Nocardioides scoriae]